MRWHLKFYITLFSVFSMAGLQNLCAQSLTDLDKKEIQRRAAFRIEEFQELLQLITDPTRSRGAIDRFIISSYSKEDSLFNQVFYDAQVVIEDDLTPIDHTQENIEVSALPVATYLNNFKLQYQKSYDETIFFTDLQFSDIKTEDFTYLIVSYNSEFRGKNSAHPNYQYKPVKRNATLRATYSSELDRWQVWIVGINYDRTDLDASEAVVETPISNTAEKEVATKKADQEPPLRKVEKNSDASLVVAEDEENKDTEKQLPQLEFTSGIPEQVKKGKNLPLAWNSSVADASITLYQGDTRLREIRKGLYGEQWNWTAIQKPGKNFSIRLYEPSTGRSVTSSPFRIKSRFPLVVKIGVPVAVIGYIIYASQSEIFPFSEIKTDTEKPPISNRGLPKIQTP